MSYPRTLHLDAQQGATFTATLDVLDSTGAAVALTTDTLECEVRDAPRGAIYATPTVTKSLVTAGRFALSLTPAQTDAMPAGVYVYDVKRTTSGGDVYRTHAGSFRVHAEVTD